MSLSALAGLLLLAGLVAVAEAQPELLATQGFRDLQVQLEGTEDRIAVERMRYGEAAQAFNTARQRFPAVLVADALGERFAATGSWQGQRGSC